MTYSTSFWSRIAMYTRACILLSILAIGGSENVEPEPTSEPFDYESVFRTCGLPTNSSDKLVITDEGEIFTDGDCESNAFAFLRENSTTCVANEVFIELSLQAPVWIRFGGNVESDGDYFLGNRKNFTLDLTDGVCIALESEYDDSRNRSFGTWVTYNCSEKFRTLCSPEPPMEGDVANQTTNNAIFLVAPEPTSEPLDYESVFRTCGLPTNSSDKLVITDEGEIFTDGDCESNSFAFLRENLTTCVANLVFIELSLQAPVWIRFGGNVAQSDGGYFLGNRKNFTLDLTDGVCIALESEYDDSRNRSVGTWATYNCSEKFRTLCSPEPPMEGDVANQTTNNGIFLVEPETTSDACSFTFNGNLTTLDNDLREFANVTTRNCRADVNDNEATLKLAIGDISTCTDDLLAFGPISGTCPEFIEEGRFVLAAVQSNPEEIRKLIPESVLHYGQNSRRSKLAPVSNTLLSYSILLPDNASSEDIRISFVADLSSTETLLVNAFFLTFENGENGLLDTTNRVLGFAPECVFHNESTNKFDSSGCECILEEGDKARCYSNHTTLFGVLLSVEATVTPSGVKILSIVTVSISLFFLLVAFFILLRVRKKVRGERIAIQINLVSSLFCLCFIILWSDVALHNSAACRMVAVLTHFFSLSTALWMTNEAILLFLKTSRWAFLTAKRRKLVIASMAFAWGTAFVWCTITAIAGFALGTYMDESELYKLQNGTTNAAAGVIQYEYCWLSGESGIRLAAIVPIVFLIMINLAISIKVAIFVYRKRKEAKNFKPTEQVNNKHKLDAQYLHHLSASIKAFVLLMPILGIPWLFMLASNSNQETTRLTFMYINAILNGLQGLFVFILYCVVGREVRIATVKSLSSLTSIMSTVDSGARKRKKSGISTNEKTVGNEYTIRPRTSSL